MGQAIKPQYHFMRAGHQVAILVFLNPLSQGRNPNAKSEAIYGASGHLPLQSEPHHAGIRHCTFLPYLVSLIANIARKRPEQNRGKSTVGS